MKHHVVNYPHIVLPSIPYSGIAEGGVVTVGRLGRILKLNSQGEVVTINGGLVKCPSNAYF